MFTYRTKNTRLNIFHVFSGHEVLCLIIIGETYIQADKKTYKVTLNELSCSRNELISAVNDYSSGDNSLCIHFGLYRLGKSHRLKITEKDYIKIFTWEEQWLEACDLFNYEYGFSTVLTSQDLRIEDGTIEDGIAASDLIELINDPHSDDIDRPMPSFRSVDSDKPFLVKKNHIIGNKNFKQFIS